MQTPTQTYTIEIDQDQYSLLVAALDSAIKAGLVKVDMDTTQDALLEMFKELPEREKEEPGIVHGFCY